MLRRARERASLLAALPEVDRLVLLGDLVELRHGPLHQALAAAAPVLSALGAALGAGREIVLVPGNHDHGLLRGWFERRGRDGAPAPLGLGAEVEWDRHEALGAVAEQLSPAQVRAAYPGVWLRDDVYAIHGHYGDRHNTVPIMERVGAGLTARAVREPAGGPARAEDYEAVLAPMYAWVDAAAQGGGLRGSGADGSFQVRAWQALSGRGGRRSLRRRAVAVAFPAAVAGLNRIGMGPLRANVSAIELRRAGLRAFAEVLERLGVSAEHVIFGHTHRAGPLPSDDPDEWVTPTGIRMLNTGSWVFDSGSLGESPGQSPYRPGFAALVGDHGPPELVNLLD